MTGFNLLPDYGPLGIENLETFLENSKSQFNNIWSERYNNSVLLKDLEVKRYLNKGSFGKILLVENKNTHQYYAMKCIMKSEIADPNKLAHAKNEQYIMQRLNFPFIVYLQFCFKDNVYLYHVMPFYIGKELLFHLHKMGKFKEPLSRFVGAQIVLCLEYLHYLDIIFRDLKPENIMYDHTGYIKLIDFGFSKIVKYRTYSICGTPEYMAPEIFNFKGYGKSVDWYAFGVVLYEMSSGKTPIDRNSVPQFFNEKNPGKIKIPKYFSSELQDFLKNILQFDLTRRFGNLKDGIGDIKKHAWFRPILWMPLLNRKLKPPYIPPQLEISEVGTLQNIELVLSKTNQFEKEFEDF